MAASEKIVGYVEGTNPDGTVTMVSVGEIRRPATYPSFYRVVHAVYNEYVELAGGRAWRCEGDPLRYEPDEHACYPFAGALRVGLHAEGIRLSNDGNGSTLRAAPFVVGETVRVRRAFDSLVPAGAEGQVLTIDARPGWCAVRFTFGMAYCPDDVLERAEACGESGCPNRAWSNGRCGPHQLDAGAYR